MNMEEIWVPVVSFDGKYKDTYEVSNLGQVKTKAKEWKNSLGYLYRYKEKILNQVPDGKGYLMVWLFKEGEKRQKAKVHRLVADAFIPNEGNKPAVDHINTIVTDNRVENLRWVTNKENSNNELSLMHNAVHSCIKGEKNKAAVKVNQYTLEGEFVRTWGCMSDPERELGFNHSKISDCCRGKRNKAYGFVWKYA